MSTQERSDEEMATTRPASTDLSEKQASLDPEKAGEAGATEAAAAPGPPGGMTFPEGGWQAWSVACGTAGILFCTFGYANAFGVYQEYYQLHFLQNKTASDIAWIGSLQIFFLFAGTLVGGPLFDQYGSIVIWPGSILYVFSVMMTSLCKEYYQFLLAQGILGGITMGMTMAPGMAATGQYFMKNRGAAMGLAVAGSSLGGVMFPIALGKMLYNPSLGFGWTVRICGFLILAVIIPSTAAVRPRLPPRKGQFFILEAFRNAKFWTIVISTCFIMMGLFTPFFYLPTFAIEQGMSTRLANYLPSILNGASFFGRLIPGILADKLGRLNMLCGVSLASGLLILCWRAMTTNASLIIFALLYGFFSGGGVSLFSVAMATVPDHPRDIGTYMGMGMAIVSIAPLAGPPINGALVTHYHSFNQSIIFSGILVIVGAISVLSAKAVAKGGLWAKN